MRVGQSDAHESLSPVPSALATAIADRYRVERPLGAGGMATVYLAHDLRHDRQVAIKVLRPDLDAALGGERFLSEIRTTARLQHAHILPLLDSGAADGLLYYVMPYIEGETLRARLERERQLPIADAVRLAREIASALDYAHRHGVIHRDIKPENVLLHDGQALVADFGIALAVQQAGGQRLTQTGLSLGTPQYMSPEQAMGERTMDARSDVYALGAVTYEMLVGEPPFTGPSVQAVVARLISEEPRGLAVQRRSIPEQVEAAVLRALEKLPADRFASAAELAAALDATATGATTRMQRAPARRTRVMLPALAALALAALALAAWGWLRPMPTPDVVRYRITIDSVPAMKDWAGELAISPDGRTIVRSGGPRGTLLVRRRDELGFSPLAGTQGASGPFFSPDGTRIGYHASGALIVVPLTGGPPTVLVDSLPIPEAPSWGADGYVYRGVQRAGGEVIVRSRPEPGARIEPITTVDTAAGELTHMQPEALPDGRTVLFRVDFRDGKSRIAAADVRTGRHAVLMEGARVRYSRSGHLLYTTNDGKLWAVPFDAKRRVTTGTSVQVGDRIPASIVGPVDFAVSASGTLAYSVEDAGARRELVWVSRAGTRSPLDSTWKGEFSSPALSPDGSRVAVVLRDDAQAHIWIRSLAGGVPTKLTGQLRGNQVEPAWSPDGRWVSYLAATARGNSGDVWRQRADGTGAADKVLTTERPLSEMAWTPRGDALVVRTTTPTTGAGDILLARLGGGATTPLVASPRAEYSPSVSPDGRWLAYSSSASGRFEVYVTPLDAPGSATWQVSTVGGSTPRWSHRGDELFYLDMQSNLVAARIATTPSFAVASTNVLFDVGDFIQTSVSRRNYDVAADDQRFLFVQRADGVKRGQVVVVEHWAEEMRRR